MPIVLEDECKLSAYFYTAEDEFTPLVGPLTTHAVVESHPTIILSGVNHLVDIPFTQQTPTGCDSAVLLDRPLLHTWRVGC